MSQETKINVQWEIRLELRDAIGKTLQQYRDTTGNK